jgi:hypothetical protein
MSDTENYPSPLDIELLLMERVAEIEDYEDNSYIMPELQFDAEMLAWMGK